MNITIETVLESREYGVYDNAGTWKQASGVNFATHYGILDELATVAGVHEGTVYGDGDELDAPDTETIFDVTFKPDSIGSYTGTVTANAEEIEVSGECVNDFDVAKIDPSTLLINILGQYRK
jgi:hypothetical protein